MGDVLLPVGLAWGVFGTISAFGIGACLAEKQHTAPACAVAAICVLAMFPLLLLGSILWVLSKAPRFLYSGVRELKREYLPTKPKLPEARIVR